MVKLGLAALFFVTALLYASVGFGGGSTYTALLVLFETDYRLIPIIALMCNIIVVSGNTLRYSQSGLIIWRKLWPLLVLSVPAAWLGGRLFVSEFVFIGLLWVALLIAGLRLLIEKQPVIPPSRQTDLHPIAAIAIGGGIGLYSGIVGIGGGIFLAPILHILRWGQAKTIAASASVFILFNSVAGLAGQVTKLSRDSLSVEIISYWPLFLAVLIGGAIGNRMGVFGLSERHIKRMTAVLILVVALRLAWRWMQMI